MLIYTGIESIPSGAHARDYFDNPMVQMLETDGSWGCRFWGEKTDINSPADVSYPLSVKWVREWAADYEFLMADRNGVGTYEVISFERDVGWGPASIVLRGDNYFDGVHWIIGLYDDACSVFGPSPNQLSQDGPWSMWFPQLPTLLATFELDRLNTSQPLSAANCKVVLTYYRGIGTLPTHLTGFAPTLPRPVLAGSATAIPARDDPFVGGPVGDSGTQSSPPAFSLSTWEDSMNSALDNSQIKWLGENPIYQILTDVGRGINLPVTPTGEIDSLSLTPAQIDWLRHEFENGSFALDAIQRAMAFWGAGRTFQTAK